MRTAILVFDSPDLELLQRGIDGGLLPNLASLLERGTYVALDDLQELLTPPSWPTFTRGCTVADHQLFCDRQLAPGSYRIKPTSAEDALRPPFWRYVSDAGLRSTIASAYSVPLLQSFRGTQLVGWGVHDPFTTKLAGPRSDPPGLIRAIERRVGHRHFHYGQRLPRTRIEYVRFIDDCLRGVEQQTQALAGLVDETDWDLFFASFSDCHQAGHLLWHFANPADSEHDQAGSDERLLCGLMDIYQAVDAGIGVLLDRLSDDAACFVGTPCGLGVNPRLGDISSELLETGGWTVRSGPGATGSRRLRALALGRSIARHTVPPTLRPALGKLVGRDYFVDELLLAGIDWSRTAAFSLPTDSGGMVRVNLVGREPHGTVSPGAEYDALYEEIRMALSDLRDADTGDPVVRRVARFDELLGVAPPGSLPDICVQWARERQPRAVHSERFGTIEVPSSTLLKSIEKAPGFLIGRGPGIPASKSRKLEGSSARLVDVAATALAWLGVSAPPEVTGKPIMALAPGRDQGGSGARRSPEDALR